MSCQPQQPYLTKNLEYFTGMMKGLVWSTTICDINIDNTNTRNNSSIIPNLPPQSWLTPWGYQIKPVPNSDELEEVILLHKKEFLDQKKIDLHHSQATTKWSKTHITTKWFSEHDTQHFQVAKEAFKQVRKTKSVQFGFDEHFWLLPNMAKKDLVVGCERLTRTDHEMPKCWQRWIAALGVQYQHESMR